MLAEQWQPRLDKNPGDYEVLDVPEHPELARVVHVLARERCTSEAQPGKVICYEALDILPLTMSRKEAWYCLMWLKIMAAKE